MTRVAVPKPESVDDPLIEEIFAWQQRPGDQCCRLLVGMQRLPQDNLSDALGLLRSQNGIDNQTAIHLKKKLAEDFREQLMFGAPTNADEAGLHRLAAQIRSKKVVIKLFLRHSLHAKLYLLFRPDPISPTKPILDEIDATLADYYGFTDQELDYVTSYDTKYRMGSDDGVEGDARRASTARSGGPKATQRAG